MVDHITTDILDIVQKNILTLNLERFIYGVMVVFNNTSVKPPFIILKSILRNILILKLKETSLVLNMEKMRVME